MKRVCVVGAGPSGLTATKTLVEHGFDVQCIEMSDRIGGHWAIDNPNGRSAAYESLRTNTPRRMSRFSDFSWPQDWPSFPSHASVQQWLQAYVDEFGFGDRLTMRTQVLAAELSPKGGWNVRTRGGEGVERQMQFDALVAATGNYWDPVVPQLPGEFHGVRLHARDYRSPTRPVEVSGRDVVVVGLGNTAIEIACEIARAGARSVQLSARSGTWILPKTIHGVPIADSAPMSHPEDPVPQLLRWLPRHFRESLARRVARRRIPEAFGARMRTFESLGLPSPPSDPLSKRAATSDELEDLLRAGSIVARGELAALDGDDVCYVDGHRSRADLVIFATGYAFRYPYLPESLIAADADDAHLFMGVIHPRAPSLALVGVSRPTGAFWPIAEAQARFFARSLSPDYRLPSARQLNRRSEPIVKRGSFSPALYGLALREEIEAGRRRGRWR